MSATTLSQLEKCYAKFMTINLYLLTAWLEIKHVYGVVKTTVQHSLCENDRKTEI